MITAQEARNKANKAYKSRIDIELASIMPEIESAMRKGEYSCWLNESKISNRAIAYLKELGYKVTSATQYNKTEYKISW